MFQKSKKEKNPEEAWQDLPKGSYRWASIDPEPPQLHFPIDAYLVKPFIVHEIA